MPEQLDASFVTEARTVAEQQRQIIALGGGGKLNLCSDGRPLEVRCTWAG